MRPRIGAPPRCSPRPPRCPETTRTRAASHDHPARARHAPRRGSGRSDRGSRAAPRGRPAPPAPSNSFTSANRAVACLRSPSRAEVDCRILSARWGGVSSRRSRPLRTALRAAAEPPGRYIDQGQEHWIFHGVHSARTSRRRVSSRAVFTSGTNSGLVLPSSWLHSLACLASSLGSALADRTW